MTIRNVKIDAKQKQDVLNEINLIEANKIKLLEQIELCKQLLLKSDGALEVLNGVLANGEKEDEMRNANEDGA